MREIKFRGETYNGRLISGDLIHQHGKVYIDEVCAECIVKPESVAQLVTYDADGKEIYEGDEFLTGLNSVVRAELRADFYFLRFVKSAE